MEFPAPFFLSSLKAPYHKELITRMLGLMLTQDLKFRLDISLQIRLALSHGASL